MYENTTSKYSHLVSYKYFYNTLIIFILVLQIMLFDNICVFKINKCMFSSTLKLNQFVKYIVFVSSR